MKRSLFSNAVVESTQSFITIFFLYFSNKLINKPPFMVSQPKEKCEVATIQLYYLSNNLGSKFYSRNICNKKVF